MLTDADWQKFWRDGYLHLGPVLNPQEVQDLQDRADALALGKIVNPDVQMQSDTGGEYTALPDAVDRFDQGTHLYRKIQGLENDDLFSNLIDRPLFREICARMYGPHNAVSIFRAMIMNKPAGQGTHLPWHQDGGTVWKLDRDPLVTIWVALDPATQANGCMDAVRGSHRLGILDLNASTLTDAQAQQHCHPELIVPLEVPSGHAVLLHNWLIHRSGINPSPTPRRAFTMCCMEARTRGILTGAHFPVVYGDIDHAPDPYVWQLQHEQTAQTEKATEAERYALSLRDENGVLQDNFAQASRYAKSLEEEVAKLRDQVQHLDLALNAAVQTQQQQHAGDSPSGEIEQLRAQAASLEASIEAVYASNSWRVTRPLRALSRTLRSH